jgi:long-subunit fatty acid transport protein
MRYASTLALLLAMAGAAWAQDQQIGARTKGMGGSYTAFEDDPISVWLNPAGIATQPDQMSLCYQTYLGFPVDQNRGPNDTIEFSVNPETILVDPAVIPSYLGFVFQVGDAENPMAVGVCFARPYHINYALDLVADPAQTVFQPEANLEQGFQRFRVAFAKDFRFVTAGEPGFFTHIAAGLGLDVAYENWRFSSPTGTFTDNKLGMGFGLGLLVGVYDNTENLKVNLGMAYQSPIHFEFNVAPDILPAFDMPEQLNVGATFYLMKDSRLRATVDLQFLKWADTAEKPVFPGKPEFEDTTNFSIGFEYRIDVEKPKIRVFPRIGFRRFGAPWDDADNLPQTGTYKLVLDTKDSVFTIITFGVGVSWSTEAGKTRSVDFAVDTGGDSFNVAVGYNHEF